jgi:hypothetical protein
MMDNVQKPNKCMVVLLEIRRQGGYYEKCCFSDVTQCGLVNVELYFGETRCLHS